MWKAAPDTVKVIDVRTPEEYAFVGHPEMAWNVPLSFVSYEKKNGKFTYGPQTNAAFVAQVRELAKPGGRPARHAAVRAAAAPWRSTSSRRPDSRAPYNIVDGVEGDVVQDPESVFNGKRMKNGWKNSAPWVYDIDPEKVILEEGASRGFTR